VGWDIRTVGVIGLGTMGAGIAEVFARGGLRVVAAEIDEAAVERGRSTLVGSVDRAVSRGRLAAAEKDAVLKRVEFAVGLEALAEVDLVVEAVPERLDLKRRLFADLDRICRPEAILATNTSSLSVTEIAVATQRPGQVLGMHFFNPAPVMKLVEVIHTVVTDREVVTAVQELCARLGKTAVTVGDRAGFVANALLFGYLNDAVAMYEGGHASREDIDAAMRVGAGLPMGPLTLLDLIGLDTAYEILETLYRRGGRDRRHAPAPLLRQLVTAGMLGRKTGRGFYPYDTPGPAPAAGPTPDESGAARAVATVGVVDHQAAAQALAAGGYEVVTATRDALAPVAVADLVIAAADDVEAARALFTELDGLCRPGAVLAAATPRVPVIECAMATGRPSDVVGMAVHRGALVEVVHTVHTSPAALATARSVATGADLTAVVCGDRAGFIVDALLLPHLNDAVRMVEVGYATADDVDAAMRLGCGYPVGPIAQLDAIGLPSARDALRAIYRQRREPSVAPAALLEHLATAGQPLSGSAAG
jgi:3-hydroxybutyryl-CoA dehydrogenase